MHGFFVGIDSGPAHLANAVQTPGVILLGRHGVFRQYMPFTGFYAGSAPDVKVVRNLVGDVCDLPVSDIKEAVSYIAAITSERGDRSSRPVVGNVGLTETDTKQFGLAKEHRELILGSGLFDGGWYSVEYPDVAQSGLEPVDHFLLYGAEQRRSPGPDFDTKWYLENYTDVASNGINPLLHYLHCGTAEGRQRGSPETGSETVSMSRAASISPSLSALFNVSPRGSRSAMPAKSDFPRTFAFYLPQFHPIPENDWAHGMGFSEWHNVIKARPLFKGHYQPRVPGELGFYDLRAKEVLRDQIHLAQAHGISGFCFYYYYFQGTKLLFDPIKNFLESDIDAPFMFLWANENWSKRWDGGDREVIIAQKHSKEDDLLFIRELLPIFNDQRYVKVGGKPVLLIYKAHLFDDVVSTVETWRSEIEKNGFPGIYLVMVDDWTADIGNPRSYGFDASYEIPSNLVPAQVLSSDTDHLGLIDGFNGRIVDYSKFASFHLSRPFPGYKRFRTVMLPWDNTARYGSGAMVHVNDQGNDYKLWLQQALLDTYQRYEPEERFVFLHSWNEWCEGTYLEPDAKRGRALLEQTREAIRISREVISIGEHAGRNAALAEVLNVAQAKDAGFAKVLQAARTQTEYVWQELERQRALVRDLHSASTHRETNVELRQAVALLEQENDSLQGQNAALQQENAGLQISTIPTAIAHPARHSPVSERVTRPLRGLGRLLRGEK